MAHWIRRLALLTGLVGLGACGSDSMGTPAAPANILISPSPLSLNQLDSVQLHATVVDANGDAIPGAHAVLSTSTPAVLSISPSGLLKADGLSGIGTVTATFDTILVTVLATVAPVATRIAVFPGSDLTVPSSASFQLTASVFDAADQPMAAAFSFNSSDPAVAAVTPNGLLTVSAGVGNATLTLTSGTLTAHADVHVVSMTRTALPGQPFDVAVSTNDVAYVATLSSLGIARINLPATSISAVAPITAPSVTFTSDGSLAYAAGGGSGVTPIDVSVDTLLPLLGAISEAPVRVMLSADDQTVYVGTGTGLWAIAASSGFSTHFGVLGAVNHISRHPSMPRIYATMPFSAKILEINTSTNAILRTFNATGQIQATGVSTDGSRLFVANELGRMDVWDLVNGVALPPVVVPGGPFGLTISPDGSKIYLSVAQLQDGGFVHVVDATSLQIVTTILTGGFPRAVAFSQDGSIAVSANEAGWVDFLP